MVEIIAFQDLQQDRPVIAEEIPLDSPRGERDSTEKRLPAITGLIVREKISIFATHVWQACSIWARKQVTFLVSVC